MIDVADTVDTLPTTKKVELEGQSTNSYVIKRLWGQQKEILRLVASGLYNNKTIAELLGVTPQTISNIINSAIGKQTIDMLQGTADLDSIDLLARLKSLSHIALTVQEDMLLDEATNPGLRNKVADKILDRSGYTPITKNLNMNVNAGLDADDMKKIKERANELRGIVAKEVVE